MMRTTGTLAIVAALAATALLGGCVSQAEYDGCYSRLVKTQDELHQTRVQVENLQTDLRQAESKNETLSKKLASAEQDKSKAVDQVRTKLAAAQTKTGSLEKSLSKTQNDLESAREDVKKLTSQVQAEKAATAEAMELLAQTTKELTEAKKKVTSLEKEISDLQEQLADAETRAAAAEKKLKEQEGDEAGE
jgi:chromosome segregation ATPase